MGDRVSRVDLFKSSKQSGRFSVSRVSAWNICTLFVRTLGETTISYYLAWHKKVKNGDNNFFSPSLGMIKTPPAEVLMWLVGSQLNNWINFFFFPTENTGTKEILSLTHNFSCPLSLCALDVVGNTRHMVLFPQLFRPRRAMFMNMSEGFGLGWLLRPRTAFQVQSYRKLTCDWPHT
jgi:hypothetical protein